MLPVTAAGPKYAQCDVMSLLDHRGDMGSGRRGVCQAPRLVGRMGASGHCMGHWGALGVILSVVHTSGVLTGTMGHTGGHGRRRWSGQFAGSSRDSRPEGQVHAGYNFCQREIGDWVAYINLSESNLLGVNYVNILLPLGTCPLNQHPKLSHGVRTRVHGLWLRP